MPQPRESSGRCGLAMGDTAVDYCDLAKGHGGAHWSADTLTPRDVPGPAYTFGHRDRQFGITDDCVPMMRCQRCGRERIGIYVEDPCPGRTAFTTAGVNTDKWRDGTA